MYESLHITPLEHIHFPKNKHFGVYNMERHSRVICALVLVSFMLLVCTKTHGKSNSNKLKLLSY